MPGLPVITQLIDEARAQAGFPELCIYAQLFSN